jgi:hypothetical protein
MPAPHRRSSTKHPSSTKHRSSAKDSAAPSGRPPTALMAAARPPIALTSLTEQWWSSWRRANALGWEYLKAMSGLMQLNMDALSQATRRR